MTVAQRFARAARQLPLNPQPRPSYRCGEVRKGLKLSLKFHRQLAAIAGNGVLAEFLDQLIARTPLVGQELTPPSSHQLENQFCNQR